MPLGMLITAAVKITKVEKKDNKQLLVIEMHSTRSMIQSSSLDADLHILQ